MLFQMPGTELGAKGASVNDTDKIPAYLWFQFEDGVREGQPKANK